MIKTSNLSKSYGSIKAIDDVSIEIRPKEIYGFIGPNGAGKSTTIKTLLNFIFADSGSATIDDLDIVLNSKQVKERVAYVSSENNLYPNLTALEVIEFKEKIHGEKDQKEKERLIKLFKIEEDKKIENMSLGNKKKVAIVSALILNTPIIILDEPTSGLDPLMQNILFSELKRLKKENKTIFISSHNLKEVQDHCDRVALIRSGKIIKVISLKDMLKEGKYVRVKGVVSGVDKIADKILMEKENETSFIFTRKIQDLILFLSKFEIENLIIENLSIEHQFLEYYSSEEDSLWKTYI